MRKLLPLVCLSILAASTTLLADNWPHWRGPTHDGVSTETGLPVKWSATENVAWKLALPAYSGSTPIIWGDTIFLNIATANGTGDLELWAVDRNKQDVVVEAADRRRQPHRAQAEHVVAVAGHRRHARLGDDRRRHAQGVRLRRQGALVARHPDRLRPLRPQLGLRVVAAAARRRAVRAGAARHEDGRPVVRAAASTRRPARRCGRSSGRPTRMRESPDSYTTPALLQYDGKTEIVITRRRRRHRPRSGDRQGALARRRASTRRTAATTASSRRRRIVGGLIVAPSRNNPLAAIRPGGTGDVDGSHIAWSFERGPDVPTPVSDGKYLYVVVDSGVVYCLDVEDGRGGLRPGAAAERLLQRVADARRRQDLRDRRERQA